jgi:hypothetical protein
VQQVFGHLISAGAREGSGLNSESSTGPYKNAGRFRSTPNPNTVPSRQAMT